LHTRNKAVLIRLTEKEKEHLKKQAEITGLKVEPFLRSLIMNMKLKPRPPEVYAKLLRELSAIGNNINQIAYIANASQNISEVKINEACDLIKKAWRYVKELG
jgi:hypothetical protein